MGFTRSQAWLRVLTLEQRQVFYECAVTDFANFSYCNARIQFVNSQADVLTVGETDFNVIAASSHDVLCLLRFAIGE